MCLPLTGTKGRGVVWESEREELDERVMSFLRAPVFLSLQPASRNDVPRHQLAPGRLHQGLLLGQLQRSAQSPGHTGGNVM